MKTILKILLLNNNNIKNLKYKNINKILDINNKILPGKLYYILYIILNILNKNKKNNIIKKNIIKLNINNTNKYIYRIYKLTNYYNQYYYTSQYYKKNLKLNILINNILKKSFSIKLLTLYSNPIISHNINNINIIIYNYNNNNNKEINEGNNKYNLPYEYYNNNKYNINLINSLKLKLILKNILKKKINIKLINLKYPYNNNNIFIQYINNILKKNKSISKTELELLNNFPKLKVNKLNIYKLYNYKKLINILNYNMNSPIKLINKITNYKEILSIYKNKTIKTFNIILPYKNPIGYSINYRGKQNISAPLSRKTKYNFSNGNLSYKNEFQIFPNLFPINSLSYNKNISKISNIFSNGKSSLTSIITYF